MIRPLLRLRRLVREGQSDAPGRVVDVLGRIGLVGYGVVHLFVAWLALQVAFGVPDAAPDVDGAVGTIARTAGGLVALALAAVGLLAFALWQVTAAAVGFRWVTGGERFRKRVGAVSKSVAVTALAVLIVDHLVGLMGAPDMTTARTLAADVLALPSGTLLLGVVAAVVLVIAGAMTYTGLRRTFMGDLDLRRVSPATRRWIELVGVAGHLSRALALAVMGLLAATAALWSDPAQVGGLDVALRTLGSTGLGSGLLVLVAIGFGAFGLFCFADAATRRA